MQPRQRRPALKGTKIGIIKTQDGHIVVARINGELCIKRLHTVEGRIWLVSENPEYDPIEIEPHMDFEIRGRVMHSVQSFC